MPVFVWEGRIGEDIQKGEMEAPNKSAVLARLKADADSADPY